ncbi:MAG: hypothetical protein WC956_04605 [bacterium]
MNSNTLGVMGFAGLVSLSGCAIGCGSDDGGSPVVHPTQDSGTDGTGGTQGDAAPEAEAEADAGPDPSIRPGFNGLFASPKYGAVDCSVVDLDMKDNSITFMCGSVVNRMGRIDLNAGDPMKSVVPAIKDQSDIGTASKLYSECGADGKIYSAQIVELANGSHIVPFNLECSQQDGGTFVRSGIAYLDATQNDKATVSPIGKADYQGGAMVIPLDGMYSALMVGNKVFIPTSESATRNGEFISTVFMGSENFNVNYVQTRIATMTSGKGPTASAMLDDIHAIQLNTSGGSMSFQLPNASLDVVDTTSLNPAAAIGGNRIDLGVPSAAPLSELALTADKKYAVVAGGSGSKLSTILIVDIQGKTVAGTIDLGNYGEVRGIDIRGNRAYVSFDDGTASVKSGKVVILDISNPDSPTILLGPIEIGHDLGAIAVHESGIVYVAVTDRWWETPGKNATRWLNIVAFDPVAASAAPADGGAGGSGGPNGPR